MLEKFLDYLAIERRYSAHTREAYQSDLAQFSEFLGEPLTEEVLRNTTRNRVRHWMLEQLDAGNKPRSVRRRMSALKALYRWAMTVGITTADPTRYLTMPKMGKSLPVFASERAMEELANWPTEPGFEGFRDRLIMELLYQTGMRNAELIGLNRSDIDFGNGWLKVTGKGNKERLLPLSPEMLRSLADYITERNSQVGFPKDGSLFLTASGKKLYPKLVYRIANKYLGIVSSLSKKSPHVLRHTFATHLLNRGAEINAVKELLGHTSLAATQVYTHTSIEELKDIHKSAHPRAGDGKIQTLK